MPHARQRPGRRRGARRAARRCEASRSVLVEGGGELHAYLLERRLADELVLYIAPKIVGGPAKSWVGGTGLASLAAAPRFVFDDEPLDLGGDLRLTARPAPSSPASEEAPAHAFDPA